MPTPDLYSLFGFVGLLLLRMLLYWLWILCEVVLNSVGRPVSSNSALETIIFAIASAAKKIWGMPCPVKPATMYWPSCSGTRPMCGSPSAEYPMTIAIALAICITRMPVGRSNRNSNREESLTSSPNAVCIGVAIFPAHEVSLHIVVEVPNSRLQHAAVIADIVPVVVVLVE